ncbi:gpi anchored protein [Rutstroemia sp. NJR-2017a WRK4]|nr:gpi anchored protein [Rutstroemia sp. NJR-2017a WRK4]
MRLNTLLGMVLLAARAALSHFVLNYPPSLGFNADNEDVSPCGGFTPSLANTSDYAVAQNAIAFTTLHPQSTFIFRATLDGTAKGNWTNLLPVFEVYGLGSICETDVVVGSEWIGQTGLLQVVQHAEDGVHYQCAAVKFIEGNLGSTPSTCTNSSGTQLSYVGDDTLTNLGNASATSTSASSSGAAAKPSKTAGSDASLSRGTAMQGFWAVAVVACSVFFGIFV